MLVHYASIISALSIYLAEGPSKHNHTNIAPFVIIKEKELHREKENVVMLSVKDRVGLLDYILPNKSIAHSIKLLHSEYRLCIYEQL